MKEVDILVKERLVPFREKLLETFAKQHPVIYTAAKTFFAGRTSRIGFQVTVDHYIVGTYTFVLNGLNIVKTEVGVLDPYLEYPLLGIVKPYALMEQRDIEKLLGDSNFITQDVIKTGLKYLAGVTIKFKE